MYDLFDNPPDVNYGNVLLPEFVYIKGAFIRDITKITQYYHRFVTSVPNEHLLVKLLLGMNVSMKRELENYVDVVKDQLGFIANSHRLTSSLGYGKVFSPGVFYGNRTSEIIIADDTEFDIQAAWRNWRELQPVTVLRHPFTDVSMARPIGRHYESRESGIAVISINIPMLALQYRAWYTQEKHIEGTTSLGTKHFVSMYPITNMVKSHLDIAIFNRMVNLYFLEEVAEYKKAYPFYILDQSLKLDNVLEKQLEILRRRPLNFDQVINAVPAVTKPHLVDVMRLPKVIPTRQVKWGLTVARLPLIRFLIDLNQFNNVSRNRMYLNRLRNSLRAMRNDKTLEHSLPHDIYRDIDDMIHRDIAPYV